MTLTPDDDNSLLVKVLSGSMNNEIGKAVDEMSNTEVEAAARSRTEIRLRYPGICAYVFEVLLDIVIKNVIGWDLENACASSDSPGLFGIPLAFSTSTEEQGRRMLHVHFQIWIKEMIEQRKLLNDNDVETRRRSEKFLCAEAD